MTTIAKLRTGRTELQEGAGISGSGPALSDRQLGGFDLFRFAFPTALLLPLETVEPMQGGGLHAVLCFFAIDDRCPRDADEFRQFLLAEAVLDTKAAELDGTLSKRLSSSAGDVRSMLPHAHSLTPNKVTTFFYIFWTSGPLRSKAVLLETFVNRGGKHVRGK
jgi:hypothetical protein